MAKVRLRFWLFNLAGGAVFLLLLVGCASPQDAEPTASPTSERYQQVPTLVEGVVEGDPQLTAPKGDGAYLVGVEIAPGLWRSEAGQEEGCYWVRRKYDGIIQEQYLGPSGVTVQVRPDDYEIEFSGCGTWEYQGSE